MRTLYLTILAMSIFQLTYPQKAFEGEIVYNLETIKKDSSFDDTNQRAAGASLTICLFKNGNNISKPNAGNLEYFYFNCSDNKIYSKYKSVDTLFYQPGDRLPSYQDSVYTTEIHYNTDTILGYICNRFILKSSTLKLTLIFSPQLPVNPRWYKNTKYSYYDVIYSQTHSLFLKSIAEFEQFASIMSAQKVLPRKVNENEFPDISQLPKAL
jgi:hypothetical protein